MTDLISGRWKFGVNGKKWHIFSWRHQRLIVRCDPDWNKEVAKIPNEYPILCSDINVSDDRCIKILATSEWIDQCTWVYAIYEPIHTCRTDYTNLIRFPVCRLRHKRHVSVLQSDDSEAIGNIKIESYNAIVCKRTGILVSKPRDSALTACNLILAAFASSDMSTLWSDIDGLT